jgi:Fe-S oxidoreductase
LHGDVISEATLWSCTACSACVDVCPVGVDPLHMITDMRRHLIAEGQFRGSPAKALQNMSRSGNPWGMAPQDRLAWAAGLDVPLAAEQDDFDVLYWIGCAASYDPRIQQIARSVVQLLSAANVRFAVLGPEERCTGESARRMGDEFLFQELAAHNIETLGRHNVGRGAKIILSHCPHCVNSFKQDYPQLGGDYEVVHHTEFLARLVNESRLAEPKGSMLTALRGHAIGASMATPISGHGTPAVTYHDPCYLARVGGITEPPRELLQVAAGAGGPKQLVEMPRNRRATSCCGAGGGRMWFDDPPTERVGNGRVQEALETGAKTVAVGCPFCMIMLKDGLAARAADVEVKDVAELLAEAMNEAVGQAPPDGNG